MNVIGKPAALKPADWFVVWKKRPAPRLRLFCFPYAGGSTFSFRDWDARLPDTMELIAVHPPSRWSRVHSAPLDSMEMFAQHLADAMLPYRDVPFACFGHSLGSLVSFQFAQELQRRGQPVPVHMVMSGRTAPDVDVPQLGWHRLERAPLIAELRKMEGTTEEVLANSELMDLFLPQLRADVALADSFRPAFSASQVLPCGLSLYNGASDEAALDTQMEQWQKYTTKEVCMRWFEGGHFYLQTARNQLLQTLLEDLAAHV